MIGFDSLTYIWEAEYKDGSILKQFDLDGTENLFSEVDHSKLYKFSWIPIKPNLNPVSIILKEGQKLKVYRKNFISFITGKQCVAYVIGIEGHPLTWIFQDETIIGDNLI